MALYGTLVLWYHYNRQANMDEPLREQSRRGFFYAQMEVMCVGYRKVSYTEQILYILRYKLRQLFRKEDKRAK